MSTSQHRGNQLACGVTATDCPSGGLDGSLSLLIPQDNGERRCAAAVGPSMTLGRELAYAEQLQPLVSLSIALCVVHLLWMDIMGSNRNIVACLSS